MLSKPLPFSLALVASLAVIASSWLLLTNKDIQQKNISDAIEVRPQTPEHSPEEITAAYREALTKADEVIQSPTLSCAEQKHALTQIFSDARVPKQSLDTHIKTFFALEKMDTGTPQSTCVATLRDLLLDVKKSL